MLAINQVWIKVSYLSVNFNEYNGSILWSLKGLAVFQYKTQFTEASLNLNIHRDVWRVKQP